jgi:hypothetical protein
VDTEGARALAARLEQEKLRKEGGQASAESDGEADSSAPVADSESGLSWRALPERLARGRPENGDKSQARLPLPERGHKGPPLQPPRPSSNGVHSGLQDEEGKSELQQEPRRELSDQPVWREQEWTARADELVLGEVELAGKAQELQRREAELAALLEREIAGDASRRDEAEQRLGEVAARAEELEQSAREQTRKRQELERRAAAAADREQELVQRQQDLEKRQVELAAAVEQQRLELAEQDEQLAGQRGELEMRLAELRRREAELVAGVQEHERSAQELERRSRELKAAEEERRLREAELERREHALQAATAELEQRQAETAGRTESEPAERRHDPVPRRVEADSAPARAPRALDDADLCSGDGEWNLDKLSALARDHAPDFPEQAIAWDAHIFYLGEHADGYGFLRPSFDPLIREVFAELLEHHLQES